MRSAAIQTAYILAVFFTFRLSILNRNCFTSVDPGIGASARGTAVSNTLA